MDDTSPTPGGAAIAEAPHAGGERPAAAITPPRRGPRPAGDAVIETHDLRKSFRTRRGPVEAVKGLDLRVEKGEIFGFLGPNGAGKSTTLRLLTTLLVPDAGTARVAGADLLTESQTVRCRIGYVAQGGGTEPAATATENLVLPGRLYGMPKATAEARAAELLDVLDLGDAAHRKVQTFSGGMRRRLDIGLGLIHSPRLLFLDEPSAGLDPQSRARIWDEVRDLRAGGTTVFITTHYLEEADALCDRLAIIDRGVLVAEGTPESLKQQVAGDAVVLEVEGDIQSARALLAAQAFVRQADVDGAALRLYVERGEIALPQIFRVLEGAAIGLRTVSLTRPSLDDVFLRQTGRSLRDGEQGG